MRAFADRARAAGHRPLPAEHRRHKTSALPTVRQAPSLTRVAPHLLPQEESHRVHRGRPGGRPRRERRGRQCPCPQGLLLPRAPARRPPRERRGAIAPFQAHIHYLTNTDEAIPTPSRPGSGLSAAVSEPRHCPRTHPLICCSVTCSTGSAAHQQLRALLLRPRPRAGDYLHAQLGDGDEAHPRHHRGSGDDDLLLHTGERRFCAIPKTHISIRPNTVGAPEHSSHSLAYSRSPTTQLAHCR